jgi:hypothetical protein
MDEFEEIKPSHERKGKSRDICQVIIAIINQYR